MAAAAVPVQRRRLFTADEFLRMAAAGVLREDDRLELAEGEVLERTSTGSAHAACVVRLTHAFSRLTGRAILLVQSPVRLSEPPCLSPT